jgi:galactitol-specific phosphotransferase system IIB component
MGSGMNEAELFNKLIKSDKYDLIQTIVDLSREVETYKEAQKIILEMVARREQLIEELRNGY